MVRAIQSTAAVSLGGVPTLIISTPSGPSRSATSLKNSRETRWNGMYGWRYASTNIASNGPFVAAQPEARVRRVHRQVGVRMPKYRRPTSVTSGSISTPSMRVCGHTAPNWFATVPAALPRIASRPAGAPFSSGSSRPAS